jgi:NTP pyrophosphatase (non-canonical NTP hydrolase)
MPLKQTTDDQPTLAMLQSEALKVKDLYDEMNLRQRARTWTNEEFMLGFAGDVGDLAKLVMAQEGAREIPGGLSALGHELADCLWSVLVLSHAYGINLAEEFLRTTSMLTSHIESQIAGDQTGTLTGAG